MLTVNAAVGANPASADPEHAFPDGDILRLEDGCSTTRAVHQHTFDKRGAPARYTFHVFNTIPLRKNIHQLRAAGASGLRDALGSARI